MGNTLKVKSGSDRYREFYSEDGRVDAIWNVTERYTGWWKEPSDGDCATILYKDQWTGGYGCWTMLRSNEGDLIWKASDGGEHQVELLKGDQL